MSFLISAGRRRRRSGGGGVITGTGPVLAALAVGDTISGKVTQGSYSSSVGSTITSTVLEYSIDGSPWAELGAATAAESNAVQVREKVTNSLGAVRFFLSEIRIVPVAAPVNATAPSLSGVAREGETLTLFLGIWTGLGPITYSSELLRNGAVIDGTSNLLTYVLTAADVGAVISASVTATNPGGSTTVVSANTSTVLSAASGDELRRESNGTITIVSLANPPAINLTREGNGTVTVRAA